MYKQQEALVYIIFVNIRRHFACNFRRRFANVLSHFATAYDQWVKERGIHKFIRHFRGKAERTKCTHEYRSFRFVSETT